MMNDRQEIRQLFFDTWEKNKTPKPLSMLEQQLIDVINYHPEYHPLLENPQVDQDYSTDNNPFLHMGLHLSLREQLHTNRPAGIHTIHQQLLAETNDKHRAEHLMMDVMAQVLWDAQQNGTLPDENSYLHSLKKLIRK